MQMEYGLISPEDCVLAVIDMQERLLPHVDGCSDVVRNTATLTEFAKLFDIPIIVSEQEKLGPTSPEIMSSLVETNPIAKKAFGCLDCEEFRSRLNAFKRKTLLLAGVETHICITQTALQALGKLNVHVISDATSSRDPNNKKIGLERIRQAGGMISSTEMFMYESLGSADHEKFKAVLSLVKKQKTN